MIIRTYFRNYYLDPSTGDAYSKERRIPPLFFLSRKLRRRPSAEKYDIYDYFTSDSNIAHSKKEADEVISELRRLGLFKEEMNVLDLSGGNGVVLSKIKREFATKNAILTEVNKNAIEFAGQLGLETIYLEFGKNSVSDILLHKNIIESSKSSKFVGEFDLILMRACIMFILDIDEFFRDLYSIVGLGGKVFIQHSVEFTLGMSLRTQLDDSSYLILRQPRTIIKSAESAGFRLLHMESEVDESLYCYENDLSIMRRVLHFFFEQLNIGILNKFRLFAWAARDRRRSHFVFTKI